MKIVTSFGNTLGPTSEIFETSDVYFKVFQILLLIEGVVFALLYRATVVQ